MAFIADGSGVGSVKLTYTSSRATDDLDTQLVRAMVAKVSESGESKVGKGGQLDEPDFIRSVVNILGEEIVSINSISVGRTAQRKQLVMAIGVDEKPSNEALKKIDEIPAIEKQHDEPNFIRSIVNILGEEILNINSMSVSRTAQRKQVVMAIGVDEKPSNEALKKIDEIPAIEKMIKIEQVFNCVIPYVHDVDDRNSISLVCRRLYELDGITRKHVTVHVLYCPNPSCLTQRFPFIDSLTLEGFSPLHINSNWRDYKRIQITPWIKEIAVKFTCLKELHIQGLVVYERSLETLATSRGKDLRVLKIDNCDGLWTKGLVHVAKYCNQLRTLSLDDSITGLESFHLRLPFNYRYDFEDLTILARKCSKSLLEEFSGAYYGKGEDYVDFKLPPNLRCFGIYDLPVTALTSLLPLANQLKELNLQCMESGPTCWCFLIKKCFNLEVLYTEDKCGDKGLEFVGMFCEKLRKFTHAGSDVTHKGLIDLAYGCKNLEYLRVSRLKDISNQAMECVGTHLKNLRDFRIILKYWKTDIPLDNGIRAMLTGCNKLERLDINLGRGGLTDVGLGYIGKYGHNLKYLSLERIGESDAGLVELSKGCPKLRTLRMTDCPFSEQAVTNLVFNMHSLRYICVKSDYRTVLALTRPDFEL
ncbi:hypothetical protein CTI12_AA101820 [Artemisia annua]|uniref:COI1 F-box domain-containing protein n=1 Tax=Artemisia annua TaxID=35608 RepID=A0A2U1PX63_ARTAN|nr:hypothetical protein CTI12_AA101820 [Artemisia annua]